MLIHLPLILSYVPSSIDPWDTSACLHSIIVHRSPICQGTSRHGSSWQRWSPFSRYVLYYPIYVYITVYETWTISKTPQSVLKMALIISWTDQKTSAMVYRHLIRASDRIAQRGLRMSFSSGSPNMDIDVGAGYTSPLQTSCKETQGLTTARR